MFERIASFQPRDRSVVSDPATSGYTRHPGSDSASAPEAPSGTSSPCSSATAAIVSAITSR